MRQYYTILFCVLLFGTLSGCSSISEEECLLGDWYQVGIADGQKGKENTAANYSKDCAEYQVQVDTKLYNEGRNQGLKSFCTYENGVLLGKSNQSYKNVCPADLLNEFISGYTPYYNLASAKSDLRTFESNVNHYIATLESENLNDSDKKAFEANLKSSTFELERAEYKIRKYEYELALHKIQREISQIIEELSISDLSDSRKAHLNKRLGTLASQRTFYEGLLQTESTIRSIQGIADLLE